MNEYKIAFIYGNNDESKGMVDGKIEFYGSMNSDALHIAYLLDYAKTKFPEMKIFDMLTIRHQPEIVAYFLTKLGITVFFNMTKYDSNNLKKYGKMGMLMVPDQLSSAQIESLKKFTTEINDFDIIINYDLSIDTGILDSKMIRSFDHETPLELINIYLERNKIENQMK